MSSIPRPPGASAITLPHPHAAADFRATTDMASSDCIQVLVRIRPSAPNERDLGNVVKRDSQTVMLRRENQSFTLDHVAGQGDSQADIFQVAGLPIVDNVEKGYNASVFAYGQTGAGKTFTMTGRLSRDNELRGLVPRIMELLFQRLQRNAAQEDGVERAFSMRCSYLEIYNESISDLLTGASGLQIREDPRTGPFVEALSLEPVHNVEDVMALMVRGAQHRSVAATQMNEESSRSHSILTATIDTRERAPNGDTTCRSSRINLVDLAGSERQKRSGAVGDRLKEANSINLSLSTLGRVIKGICEGQRTPPFRESALTRLLQDSLGGNAKTVMIANISPAQASAAETHTTLEFATRAKFIKNRAIRNELVQADPVALQKEVLRLTAQLADLRGSASAAALAVVQAELTAATVAGGCLAEELTAAEHACRSTQAKLEAEMRECERRREEVVESEAQAAQVAATLNARLEAAQKEGAAAAAALNARLEAAQKEGAAAAAALNARLEAAQKEGATAAAALQERLQAADAARVATQEALERTLAEGERASAEAQVAAAAKHAALEDSRAAEREQNRLREDLQVRADTLQAELSAAVGGREQVTAQLEALREESQAATARLQEELLSSRQEAAEKLATVVDDLVSALKEASAAQAAADDALVGARREAAEAEAELKAQLESAAAQAAAMEAGLAAELAALQAEKEQLGCSLADAEAALEAESSGGEEARGRVAELKAQLAASDAASGELRVQLAAAEARSSATRDEVLQVTANLDAVRDTLAMAQEAAAAAAMQAEGAAAAAAVELASAQQKGELIAAELVASRSEVAQLETALGKSEQDTALAREEADAKNREWTALIAKIEASSLAQLSEAREAAAAQLAGTEKAAAAAHAALQADVERGEAALADTRAAAAAAMEDAQAAAATQLADAQAAAAAEMEDAQAAAATKLADARAAAAAGQAALQAELDAAQEATRAAEKRASASKKRESTLRASLDEALQAASVAATAAQQEMHALAGELKAQVAASDAAVTELQGRLAAAEAAAAVSAGEVSEARQDLEVVTAERESRDWELLELRTQLAAETASGAEAAAAAKELQRLLERLKDDKRAADARADALVQELQSVKTASERETAAAAEAREQAGTLAAALADLQPKLTAARAAVAQQKEKRRLTIERRSQELACAKHDAAESQHKMQAAIQKLTKEVAASQAAAEASAAEEARLRALADEVAAVAEQQKRDLTARVDELQRRLVKAEEEAVVVPAEVALLAESPGAAKAPARRPLGVLDGNATAAEEQQAGAAAKGTPIKAWRKAHPRRAAIAARAALKGGKTDETDSEARPGGLTIPTDECLASTDEEGEDCTSHEGPELHRAVPKAPIGTRSRLRGH